MADANEIKKTFYELVESYAQDRESAETKSKIADFAKLLPTEKEEKFNLLKNLEAAVRADVRLPGKINLPAPIKKNIGTLLTNLKKDMDSLQPKPTEREDKPNKKPERTDNKHTDLSPEEFKAKLDKLYKTFTASLADTDISAVDKEINKDDKEMRGYVKNLRKLIADNTDFNLDGVPNGPILKTIRRALKNYKEKQNNHDTERTNRPDKKKKDRNKGGPDMAEEKIITDEMKEKLKKLGLSDDEISALDYDAATAKLKANEDDGKPKEGEGDGKPKEGEGDDKPKEGDDKPKDPTAELEVTDQPKTEENEHTDEKAPWVIRKQKWFDENIKPANADYKVTRADNEFEVEFAGGSIHYEAETKAVVSKDASYKVYEALLKDPDNAQRPVKFPENASEHLTNMLYAASILNETSDGKPHEMIGLDKSKLNMDAIEKALKEAGYGDAEIKKVKDYYEAHEGKPAAEDQHDHGADLSDAVKGVKAESFKRTKDMNRLEFTPEPADKGLFGTYNLETGEINIMQPDGPDKMRIIYTSNEPSDTPFKQTKLTEDEIKHIQEQAKPAIETEVKRILDDRARMKELETGGLITFGKNDLDGSITFTPKEPENEASKKACDEFRALYTAHDPKKDNDFVAQVISKEPDLMTKIHNDENTPQPQKDILVEKMNSYNNVGELLKQRAELIDKGEDKLDAKEKVALTKNYIALLAEYKKDPALVETAMADDLKRNNSAERTKIYEDVKSDDKRKEFEENLATMKDYSKKAKEAASGGGKLTIQDYMNQKYDAELKAGTIKPEDVAKKTAQQIQFNNAYHSYQAQRSTNTK